MTMQPLKAYVKNGRLLLDEPTDLPEGQDYETITRDTERNFWMNAKEACAYGLVHRIVERLADVP